MSNLKEANSCPDGYRALSTSELRELLQNEDKMDQIINLNEKFQELQLQRESLLASNRGLAEESLARRPPLNTGKLQLAEKYRQLSDLTTVCREKRKQLGPQQLSSDGSWVECQTSCDTHKKKPSNPLLSCSTHARTQPVSTCMAHALPPAKKAGCRAPSFLPPLNI